MDLRELRKKVNEMCNEADNLEIEVLMILNGKMVTIKDIFIEDGSYVLIETE